MNKDNQLSTPQSVTEVMQNRPQNFDKAKKAKHGRHHCFYECGRFFPSKKEAALHSPCYMREIDEERYNGIIKPKLEEMGAKTSGSGGSSSNDNGGEGEEKCTKKQTSKKDGEEEMGSFEHFLRTLSEWDKNVQWDINWRRRFPNYINPNPF